MALRSIFIFGVFLRLVRTAQCAVYQGAPRGGEFDMSGFTDERMKTPSTRNTTMTMHITRGTDYLSAAQIPTNNIASASHRMNHTNCHTAARKVFVTRTVRTAQSLNVVHGISGI